MIFFFRKVSLYCKKNFRKDYHLFKTRRFFVSRADFNVNSYKSCVDVSFGKIKNMLVVLEEKINDHLRDLTR